MKRIAAIAAVLMLGSPVVAHHPHVGYKTHTITMSCYRGPWNDVIWDRPEPVFLDSLRSYGYTATQALSIGELLCRDSSLVGNEDAQRNKLIDVLRQNPPSRT